MFQPDKNRSTEDGIRIEPASNSKISMRSPSSNAIMIIITELVIIVILRRGKYEMNFKI